MNQILTKLALTESDSDPHSQEFDIATIRAITAIKFGNARLKRGTPLGTMEDETNGTTEGALIGTKQGEPNGSEKVQQQVQ